VVLGITMVWQGRFAEAEPWLGRAERALRVGAQPTAWLLLYYGRGWLALGLGRDRDALAAFRSAERQVEQVVTPVLARTRSYLLQTLVRLGETDRVERALAELDEQERQAGQMCIALAALRLAQGDPQAATAALASVLDGSASLLNSRVWTVQAFLLEAFARDAIGDAAAADHALERALDLAEPDGLLLPFLVHPAPALLARHSRQRTAHASLVAEILNRLAGANKPASTSGEPERVREPLSESETRVLRYLPTNLSVPEIADEIYLSVNTVKTHMRHLYGKLGVHGRAQAVERARALGLLALSSRTPSR
jgi:LuxR family transcriptional regulator, maltose regulon positive regulatory protein